MSIRTVVRSYGWLPCLLALLAVPLAACGGSTTGSDTNDSSSSAPVDPGGYAAYVDVNGNGVNDYVETPPYHDPGAGAPPHSFTDADGDGVCDYAQDGSRSWHGPGYVDADGDGVCDRWPQGPRGSGPRR